MNARPTLLKVLLIEQHWQKYETFCAEYEKVAKQTARELSGTAPSKAQYYRWLSGQLKGGVPYPDACRVLERMFPGRTVAELLSPCRPDTGLSDRQPAVSRYADLVGVYTTRADFTSRMPPANLLEGASDVRAAGLSLNMICQQVPDQRLISFVEDGASLRCLFLDPDGEAIRRREREERHRPGTLSTLTGLNITILTDRVRERLSPTARERLRVSIYDETVRFNILLIDNRIGVVQPYLPEARGVDSPTLLLEREYDGGAGLFPVFARVFDALWERSTPR
jgi:hypothetical protein